MDKNFMVVLHDEELLDDTSLDALKGGWCLIFICNCNKSESNCNDYCPSDTGSPTDPGGQE